MTKQPRTPLDDVATPHLLQLNTLLSPCWLPFPPPPPPHALLATASTRLTRGKQLAVKQIMATEHWQREGREWQSDRCTLEKEWG